jgi:hypothetical protein
MKLTARTCLVAASILGSLVVHAALTACSSTSSTNAHADVPPSALSTCKKWQVQGFLPTTFTFKPLVVTNTDGTTSNSTFPTYDTFELPDGWEPVSGSEFGSITARKCVSQ